ncbi:MAG TPA: hypothetical protein VIU41_10860, partial [Geobacteraceae bacterium]
LGAGGLVLAGVGLFLALPTGRRFIRELTAGLAVIGSSDPWLDSISELRPLLFPAGRLDLWHVSETLSLLWWLVPIILFMIFRLWRQSGCREFRHALFLAFGGLLWVIPLFRERYIHLAAVVIAIGGGWACVWLRTKLTQRGWGAFVRPAQAGSLLILLLPTAPFLWQLPAVALPAAERYDLQDAMVWLRDKTPATADFATPLSPPAYGVLSEWHNGAYIDYLGRRPTVATNFGWETHGLFESAAFLTMTDPDAAERLLLENRVRYLVLDDISAMLPAQAAIAAYGEKSGRYGALVLPPFKPLASMYYRLYIQDGAAYQVADVSAAALGGYRLVFETVGTNFDPVVGPVSRYKIYQVVPGALVAGRARPGATVTLELPLKSPTGRLFSWKSGVVADQTGRFSCRVPYATDRPSGDVVPQDSYLVHSGGATVRLVVPEAAVANGQTVQLTTP